MYSPNPLRFIVKERDTVDIEVGDLHSYPTAKIAEGGRQFIYGYPGSGSCQEQMKDLIYGPIRLHGVAPPTEHSRVLQLTMNDIAFYHSSNTER